MTQPPGPGQPYDPNQFPQNPGQFGGPAPDQFGQPQPPVTGPQQAFGQPQAAQQPFGQQPFEQQAWAQQHQQWGSQPAKSGNGKLIGILAGVAVLVVAVGVTLWLVLGGSRGVEATVEQLVDAMIDGDTNAVLEVVCPDLQAEIIEDADMDALPSGVQYEISQVQEHGDTGSAVVTLKFLDETETATFVLEKNSDGDFVVCGID